MKELIFNDWHFMPHFKRNGYTYGCLWKGEKPAEWTLANLVRMGADELSRFQARAK